MGMGLPLDSVKADLVICAIVRVSTWMWLKYIAIPWSIYQSSISEFNRLISSEQSNASTQTLYQKICLMCLIQHTKLCMHTLFRHAQRERIEVQCQVFNHQIKYFVIGFPLLALLQLLEASNTTACNPSVVQQTKFSCDPYLYINGPSIKDSPTLDECRRIYEFMKKTMCK